MSLLQIVDASNAILWDADDLTGLNNPYGLKTCAWAIDKGRTPTGLDLARPVSGTGAIKVQDRADAKVMSWVQGYTGVTSNNPEDIRRAFGVLSQLLSVSTDESGYRIRYRPGDSMEIRYVEYLGTEFLPNLERGQPGEVRKLYDQLMDPDGQVVEVWRQPFDLGELLDSDVNKAQNSLFLAIGTSQAPLLWTWDSTTNVTNGAPDALTERFKVTLATTGTRNLQFTTAAASAAAGQQWLAKLWKIRASAAGVVRARVVIEFLSSTSVVLDSALGSLTSVGTTEMELPFATTLTAPTNTDRVRVSVQFQNSASTSVDVYMTEIQLEKGQTSTNPTFARTSIAFTQNGLQVASGVPRYEAGKYGGGILLEEGTTNLVLRSDEFDNAYWSKTRCSITANATTAPDGTVTADKLVEDASNNSHIMDRGAVFTLGQPGTQSFYIKAAERSWLNLVLDNGDCYFNAATGLFGTMSANISSTAKDMGNGWWRVTVSDASIGANQNVTVRMANANGGQVYAGDGVSGIYIWRVQAEALAYGTTAMQTVAATATRNAETLTIPTANVLSGTVGTVEHWVSPQRAAGTNLEYLFDGGGGANANLEVWIGTDGKLNLKYGTGSSTVTLTSASALTQNTFTHVAWRWSSAGVALLISGVSVGSSATTPGIVFGASAFLGSNQSSALQGDSLLDDWRASSVARADAQILSVATSSSPAPEDSSTTYKLEFDSDLGVDLTDAPSMYRTGTETVGNDAASTTLMGMAMPLKVQGDMPAPLEAVFTATSATIAKLRLAMRGRRRTGDRVLVNLINYGKTVQLETGSLLTDTTASSDGNATGSGNNAPSTSFGTDNTLTATRLTMDILDYLHLSGYTDGTWDIYAKVGNGAGTGTYSLYATWRFTASGTPVTEPTTAFAISLASTPTWVWIKVATVRVRADETLPRLKFDFHARRDSGADPLKWDELMFIPIGNDARYSVGGALAATDTLHADAGKGLVRQFNANGQLLVSGTREGFLPEGQAGLNAVIFDTVTSQLHTDVSHAGKLGFRYSPRWAI